VFQKPSCRSPVREAQIRDLSAPVLALLRCTKNLSFWNTEPVRESERFPKFLNLICPVWDTRVYQLGLSFVGAGSASMTRPFGWGKRCSVGVTLTIWISILPGPPFVSIFRGSSSPVKRLINSTFRLDSAIARARRCRNPSRSPPGSGHATSARSAYASRASSVRPARHHRRDGVRLRIGVAMAPPHARVDARIARPARHRTFSEWRDSSRRRTNPRSSRVCG